MPSDTWKVPAGPDAFPTLRRKLTPRELEVLGLTARGMTSKQIAVHLGISPRTADVHRTHLIRKLGFRNRVEAVRYALSAGILTLSPSELRLPHAELTIA
jgi:DNA-binding CsgD family transcriptional regulator